MPQLSVIMSVYNGERYLSEAIDSILSQSYKDFEFIIINDCSTDNTQKILEEYQQNDARIKIYTKEKNIGLTGFIQNLNLGISLAQGKYIARMDADDIALPERFIKQTNFLEKNPNIFIVGSQINLINEKNEIIGEKIGAVNHKDIVKRMEKSIQLFHPAIMFRNTNDTRYRDKFQFCEDYDLYLNLITQGKLFANINEKLLHYRILDKSISRKSDNFVKKLMVEKSLSFYKQRALNKHDDYNLFDNKEILEINNLNFKNNLNELFFALETTIKLNKREKTSFLIKKIKKHYPKEKIPFKYFFFSIVPMFIFRILKKITW